MEIYEVSILFLPLRKLLLRLCQSVSLFLTFFSAFVLLPRRLSSVCSVKTKHVCSAAATFDAFSRFNWSTPSPSQQTASRLIVDLLKLKGDGVNGLFPIRSLCACKRVEALRSLPKVSLCVCFHHFLFPLSSAANSPARCDDSNSNTVHSRTQPHSAEVKNTATPCVVRGARPLCSTFTQIQSLMFSKPPKKEKKTLSMTRFLLWFMESASESEMPRRQIKHESF